MDHSAIAAKLTEIFRNLFAIPALAITADTTAADVPGWDSLSHINLVMAVERGFAIRLSTREVRSMKNVGDFMEVIAKKIS